MPIAEHKPAQLRKPQTKAEAPFHDLNGQRTTIWDGNSLAELRNQYYWGSTPIAWYDSNTHFQHQNYLGTERLQTSYNGAIEGTYTSLPWGDALTGAGTGSDAYTGASAVDDAYHFAGLDHDYESNTDHAQFRNYSSTQGRWLVPDPYDGSYDLSNPQSLNRYAYVANNPLTFTDPDGLYLVANCKSQCGKIWGFGNPFGGLGEFDFLALAYG